jgi:hypothetical protein
MWMYVYDLPQQQFHMITSNGSLVIAIKPKAQ